MSVPCIQANDQSEAWRKIGHNAPQVEIEGPYSNQYRIFIGDIDGDWIGLLPSEVKLLVKRLNVALLTITAKRSQQGRKAKTA